MTMTDTAYRSDRDDVASYATLDGACEAAAHLVEVGFDERDVAISPRGFRVVDTHSLEDRVRNGFRLGAIAGAIVTGAGALIAIGGWAALFATMVPAVVLGLIGGSVLGVLLAIARHIRTRRTRFGAEQPELAPGQFDITVGHDHDRANHQLAGWWRPTAVPARWQTS